MNAGISSSGLVRQAAYRLLKQDADYDKMNLFLHANIAAYKASDLFQKCRMNWPRLLTNIYASG
jgi:hypothetical protein